MESLKKPKLKKAATMVMAVGLLSGMAACSSGGGGEQPPGGGSTGSGDGGGADPFAVASMDEACADAEGELNVRRTTDPDDFNKEVEPFTAKYPDIKINYVSQRPEGVVQQILPEIQAHQPLDVDVVDLGLDNAEPFITNDLVAKVDWASLGIPKDWIVDIDGVSYYRTEREFLGLVYNKDNVDPADLPSTWEELIDPRWSGQVVVDPRATSLSQLSIAWGKDKAVDWYKRLMQTDKPLVTTGESAGVVKVGGGEAKLSTSAYDATVRQQQATGAPVDIKYLDVVGAKDHYAVILKQAPHPKAAICFLAWWGGEEGQAQQLKVELKQNISEPPDMPAGSVLGAQEDEKDAALVAETAGEMSKATIQ